MPRRIIRRGRFIDRPARLIACLRLHPIAIRGLIVELFLYLIVNTVDVFLSLILMAMLVRSIMSLLMMDEDNVIYAIACTITEPFIIPVRTQRMVSGAAARCLFFLRGNDTRHRAGDALVHTHILTTEFSIHTYGGLLCLFPNPSKRNIC